MRLAFQMDESTKAWLGRSLRTSLGVVAHALAEETARGPAPPPGQRRQWLEDRWDALIARETHALEEAWPGRAIPGPTAWPGYIATRTRLLRRLDAVESKTQYAEVPAENADTSVHHGKHRPAFPWIELPLKDKKSRLRGTPDLVEIRNRRVRVVDLKSGVHQELIQPSQLRQLLLYAHLVWTVAGVMPDDVVIQDVKGREQVTRVDADDVSAEVSRAGQAIDSFNQMVSAGRFAAMPSPEHCRSCPFRVVCTSYWAARTRDWPRLDVRGVVMAVDNFSVTVQLTGQADGSSPFRILPDSDRQFTEGEEIVVLDLERAGPDTGRMRWHSRLRRPAGPKLNG